MYESVIQRVNNLLTENKISENEFAKRIGIPQKTVNNYLSNKRKISIEFIESFSRSFGLSIDWVLNGEEPVKSYSSGRPYYNVDFLGGFDLSAPDNTINPDYNIDYQPYNKDGVIWCNITGESMEPKINSGDKIAISEILDWDKCLVCGEIYAIITKNNLRTVKIVYEDTGDKFILKAINKEFNPQPIKKNMILKVFKVLGCIKAF